MFNTYEDKKDLIIGDTITYWDSHTEENTTHVIETEAQLEQAKNDDCISLLLTEQNVKDK